MNMPDDVGEARKALADGDFARARAHLAVARQEGADPNTLAELRQEIDDAESAITQSSSKHLLWSIAVAVVAYVVLSLQSKEAWGVAWGLLALIAVPAGVGILAGMSLPPHSQSRDRFTRALWLGMTAMATYATAGVILSHRKIATDSTQLMQVFLAGALSVVAFSVVAGLVAGFAARMVGRK